MQPADSSNNAPSRDPRPAAAKRPGATRKSQGTPPGGDRRQISISLMGLLPGVRALAARRRISISAAIRVAVLPLLADGPSAGDDSQGRLTVLEGKVKRLTLNFNEEACALLVSRAWAAGVSRGQYLSLLMAGAPPAPLPKDLAPAITQLKASNDRLAAMSVDLNAFMRLLTCVPAEQLERYRADLHSLSGNVRAHLELAATLIAELDQARRPRC